LPITSTPWAVSAAKPGDWIVAFPVAPQLTATRPASVHLTRSIAAELLPRRIRLVTAVNWLLAHLAVRGEALQVERPLPAVLEPWTEPVQEHPGDFVVG
jgi:hypothetical protein